MTHTPGPWRSQSVTTVNERGTFVYKRIVSPQGDVITSDRGYKGDNADAEANAHLIAAAPELMEAAKEVLQQLDSYVSEGRKGAGLKRFAGWFCVSDLRAAIAKATPQPKETP